MDVEELVVPADETTHMGAVWRLKERIRESDGALKQPRGQFERAYGEQRDYLLLSGDGIVAFGVVHADGYLSLLGVSPRHRRSGLGTALLDSIAADYPTITCHTRATNDGVIAFYEQAGFEVVRRIDAYYPDGTDGLFLRLGD